MRNWSNNTYEAAIGQPPPQETFTVEVSRPTNLGTIGPDITNRVLSDKAVIDVKPTAAPLWPGKKEAAAAINAMYDVLLDHFHYDEMPDLKYCQHDNAY